MSRPDKPKPRSPQRPSNKQKISGKASIGSPAAKEGPETAATHDKLAKIAGFQAVAALFSRHPQRVMRLYYDEKMKNAVGDFCAQMARMRRPYRLVEDGELEKISGTVLHGGVVAAATPKTVQEFDLKSAMVWARRGEPLLILDGVGNPHNLGAIVRTMAYFGLKYLLISDHPAQAALSDAAHRVAEGGLEHVEVYRASACARVCRQLREYYRVVGTSLSPKAVELSHLGEDQRPLAIVLGNEEHGLPAETLAACEEQVVIPGSGLVQSLNVAATAAILIHAIAANPPAQTRPGSGKPQAR